ncbi:MAG: sugar transferase [Actinobacteria bacterium]|nr:sugar transferase [Actinomycetota bacterium]
MVIIVGSGEKSEIKTIKNNIVESPRANVSLTKNASGIVLKRAIDLIASSIGLISLAPLLLVIAILIRIDSPGPAIFAQRRIGKDGKEFTFYKFRSMYRDCDESLHQDYMAKLINSSTEDLKGKDGCFKLEDDPRVTRVGRFLRKSSLDELPQLINVLRGEMSLVGPRPALPYEVEIYDPWHMGRLAVIPGITGLWQVSGRSEKNFQEMVELDLKYIDNWSIWLDLKIILKTFQVIFNKQGAW